MHPELTAIAFDTLRLALTIGVGVLATLIVLQWRANEAKRAPGVLADVKLPNPPVVDADFADLPPLEPVIDPERDPSAMLGSAARKVRSDKGTKRAPKADKPPAKPAKTVRKPVKRKAKNRKTAEGWAIPESMDMRSPAYKHWYQKKKNRSEGQKRAHAKRMKEKAKLAMAVRITEKGPEAKTFGSFKEAAKYLKDKNGKLTEPRIDRRRRENLSPARRDQLAANIKKAQQARWAKDNPDLPTVEKLTTP